MGSRGELTPQAAAGARARLVVVAALVALAGCGGDDAPQDTQPKRPTTLGFEAASGPDLPPEVGTGDPVRIAGVNVGAVTAVTRTPDGATVRMRIRLRPVWPTTSGAWPPHMDATIKIRPRIFKQGDFFLDLRPGTYEAPEIEEGARLPKGRTVVDQLGMQLFGRH
jgi:hypothetical protein